MDEEELIERRRREREQLLKKLGGKPEVLAAAAAKPVTPPELKIAMALTQAKAGILDKEIRKLSAKKEKMAALQAGDKNGGKIKQERRSTSSSTADSSGSDSSSSRGKRRREKKKRRRSSRRSGSSYSGTSRESEVWVLNTLLLFCFRIFFEFISDASSGFFNC